MTQEPSSDLFFSLNNAVAVSLLPPGYAADT
jgi:hypothetical protein